MEVKEVSYETEKIPTPKEVGTTTEETTPDIKVMSEYEITKLMNEYEQLEAQIQALNDRKQQIRRTIYGELVIQNVEETSIITSSGTKFVLRIQKTRRERVDVKLLRADLGEKAEKYITITESEFLSIRPAKKTRKDLQP